MSEYEANREKRLATLRDEDEREMARIRTRVEEERRAEEERLRRLQEMKPPKRQGGLYDRFFELTADATAVAKRAILRQEVEKRQEEAEAR